MEAGGRAEDQDAADPLRARRPCELVPVENDHFALDELVAVLGRAGAARRLGISYHCLWAWLSRRRKNMHKEMAVRVLRSLWEIRNDAQVAAEHPVRSP